MSPAPWAMSPGPEVWGTEPMAQSAWRKARAAHAARAVSPELWAMSARPAVRPAPWAMSSEPLRGGSDAPNSATDQTACLAHSPWPMAQSALRRALLTLSLIILLGSTALAATNVGGQIAVDTTWTTAGSPYIV